MNDRRIAITTVDNPYDPLDDFDNWYEFDHEKGYYTAEYLARVLKTTDRVGKRVDEMSTEDAIDEIIRMNVGPVAYKKVVKPPIGTPA